MKRRGNISYMLFLAVTAAVGGLLFGYDTAVIFGTVELVTARFGLDSLQQGWYVGCALAGSIAGVLCAGVLSDRLGRRRTMLVSAVLFTVSAVGCALCVDFTQLVVYRIVGGLGIGVVSVVSPLYISEVSAARRRGMLVSFYQLAVTMGFLAAYTVNYLLLRMGQTAGFETAWMQRIFVDEVWRGMLGAETLPALLFFVIIFFIPESPRWLALRGRTDRALRVLGRINGDRAEAAAELAAIETAVGGGQTPQWRLLLSKGIRTAVLVGTAIAILGQFMGVNAVLYYGPSIFERAGWSGSDSLFAQILVGAVNMLTTVLALAIIDRVGRKKLVYWGVSGMALSLLLFAFTTLLGNLFYCEGCLNYIARRTLKNKEMNVFRLFAVVVVFIGAQLQFGLVWDLADVLMGIMAIINLPVIVILGNTALKCLDDYQAQKKEGKNPCFKAESIGLEGKTEFWN